MSVSRRRSRPASSFVPAIPTDRALLPVGITTILPDAASRVRELERILLDLLGLWGYREIILPTFEYLDVLTPGLHTHIIEKGYQLTDRTTGRTLVLRPDATAQIARTIAMGMLGEGVPLRLAYRTSVFRYEPEHVGRDREQLQIGAELAGLAGPAGDAEIISLMVDCLRRLGVKAFRISLGHVGFLQALLRGSGLTPSEQKQAEHAAARRNVPELESIMSGRRLSRPHVRAILEAPALYGGEEVIARGRALAGRDRDVRMALDRLAAVFRILQVAGHGEHILLDLGELRGFDYYDGVVFDVFADGVGYEIGGGGRYDRLIGQFGRDLPSTGFAFDVDRLFRVVEAVDTVQRGDGPEYLLAASPDFMGAAMALARQLRLIGMRVVLGSSPLHGSTGLRQALEEAGLARARAVVCLGLTGIKRDDVLVVHDVIRAGKLTALNVAALRAQGASLFRREAVAEALKTGREGH